MDISNSVLLITVRSSRADKKFDTTVGHIEDIIFGMSCKIHIKQLRYKPLQLKLRVFLTGCVIAMVTFKCKTVTTTCLTMIGWHLCDTMIIHCGITC